MSNGGDVGDADRDSFQIVGKGKKVGQALFENMISGMPISP